MTPPTPIPLNNWPQLVQQHGIVAILRSVPTIHAVPLAQHLYGAGIRLLEVALSDDLGLPALRAIREALPGDLLVGAGTVLTPTLAKQAQEAGAQFLLTPHFVPEVSEYAQQHGLPIVSGAMTPGELLAARAAGSDVVKLFPAGNLGPGYLKSLLGPYPDLQMMVVGAVDAGNLADFLKAGATSAGIGSYLTATDWDKPDFELLARRAAELLQIVKQAQKA